MSYGLSFEETPAESVQRNRREQLEAAADQRRSDPLVLTLRQDPERAQHLHREQAPRRVEQARAEHHVPDDLVSFFRDERKPFASPYSVAQLVDEVCNNRDVIFSERRVM